jgi:ATP-dependent DNA helicase RecG
MTLEKLVQNVARGEDSENQFKADVTSLDSLAAEIVSFLNAKGGTIYIGIDDSGELKGLSAEDVRRGNQMISNSAQIFADEQPTRATMEWLEREGGTRGRWRVVER